MISDWFDCAPECLQSGYAFHAEADQYRCLVCGQTFARTEVFLLDGRFWQAEQAAARHVCDAHGGMATVLLAMEKSRTGLTDPQKELLRLTLAGQTDAQAAQAMGLQPSTVRHMRFTLRERARQARLYLALYQLAENAVRDGRSRGRASELIGAHKNATVVDDRYRITRREEEQALASCFASLEPPRLKVFPAREKKKIIVLRKLAALFAPGQVYSEKQVNEVLKPVYPDFATLRRYLIEYGWMRRSADGSEYRLTQEAPPCQP